MATKIEWTDHTWNPTTGCKKVSPGCKHCYAERLWPKVSAAEAKRTGLPRRAFTDVALHPERLDKPGRMRKPAMFFVDSMSDLFQDDVPFDFVDKVFAAMERAPQHTFQILTKRAERMRDYFILSQKDWLPLRNVWLGVSVENQEEADKRIPFLLQTPAAVRFLSCEPLLGPIQLPGFNARESWCPICKAFVPDNMGRPHEAEHDVEIGLHYDPAKHCASGFDLIHWVISGGESGSKARPTHPDWHRSLRDQCAAAGVPFFFKQWGEYGPTMFEAARHLGPGGAAIGATDIAFTRFGPPGQQVDFPVIKVGKKAAGRLLDGQLHDGYPA